MKKLLWSNQLALCICWYDLKRHYGKIAKWEKEEKKSHKMGKGKVKSLKKCQNYKIVETKKKVSNIISTLID